MNDFLPSVRRDDSFEGSSSSMKSFIRELYKARVEDRRLIDVLTSRLNYVEVELNNYKSRDFNNQSQLRLRDRDNSNINTGVQQRLESTVNQITSFNKRAEHQFSNLQKEIYVLQSRLNALAATGKSFQTALAESHHLNLEAVNLKSRMQALVAEITKLR